MTQGVTIGMLLAGSYLFGSLPFGLWIAKQWKGVDIRTLGSGNIGSTNVWRICGPVAGLLAFTLDLLKGLLPPLVGLKLGLASQWQILAALCGILGHNYSVWLGFKGGKGIATSLGALIGTAPLAGFTALGIFLVELLTLRWVSLGSILAAIALPFLMLAFYPGDPYRLVFGLLAGGMALYKHRANIQRLRVGTEPKIPLPWAKNEGGGQKPEGSHHAQSPTPNSQPTQAGTRDNAAR